MADPQGAAPQGRVTLRTVAHAAGVSVATASKALSGRGQVRAETRARVLAAAQQLSFQSSSAHRMSPRAGLVGVLAHNMVKKSSLRVLLGIEEALTAEETGMLLCDARGDSIREQHQLRALCARRVDGLIIAGARTDPRPSLGELPVPVVYAVAPSENPDDNSVVSDNVAAGELAIQHLLSRSRSKIAHITGDLSYSAARERAAGALSALTEAGLTPAGGCVFHGRWDEAWGRGAMRLLLTENEPVDAVFAGNDQIARGVLEAVTEHGLGVPDDIAIIGLDNIDLLVANARPQLTSIDMGLEEIGMVAVQRLLAAIDGTGESGMTMLPCRVVQRGSTAPLA